MDSNEKLELLRRFAPTLHFDALERWRPCLADAYMARSTFLEDGEQALPGTPPAEAAMLAHLEELESRINPLAGGPDHDTQRRSNAMLAAYEPEQGLAAAGSCYGRIIRKPRGVAFLQYWLFYPDNPCVLPPGRHDGDWELVQVRLRELDAGYAATHATLAGHGKPVTRSFRSKRGGPDVYVAVDSHASYFVAGAHPMLPLSDVCTPAAPGMTPTVVPIPIAPDKVDWAHWHGRWGVDRGPGTWLALKLGLRRTPSFMRRLNHLGAGESPPSPGRQGASWSRPRAFQARGTQRRGTNVTLQRLAHFIGRATWPRKQPQVEVVPEAPEAAGAPARYRIETEPAGRFLRRVTRVSVAFWEERPNGSRRALAMHSVRAGRPAGPFTIPPPGRARLARRRLQPAAPARRTGPVAGGAGAGLSSRRWGDAGRAFVRPPAASLPGASRGRHALGGSGGGAPAPPGRRRSSRPGAAAPARGCGPGRGRPGTRR